MRYLAGPTKALQRAHGTKRETYPALGGADTRTRGFKHGHAARRRRPLCTSGSRMSSGEPIESPAPHSERRVPLGRRAARGIYTKFHNIRSGYEGVDINKYMVRRGRRSAGRQAEWMRGVWEGKRGPARWLREKAEATKRACAERNKLHVVGIGVRSLTEVELKCRKAEIPCFAPGGRASRYYLGAIEV
jgi:hypothetical protein